MKVAFQPLAISMNVSITILRDVWVIFYARKVTHFLWVCLKSSMLCTLIWYRPTSHAFELLNESFCYQKLLKWVDLSSGYLDSGQQSLVLTYLLHRQFRAILRLRAQLIPMVRYKIRNSCISLTLTEEWRTTFWNLFKFSLWVPETLNDCLLIRQHLSPI